MGKNKPSAIVAQIPQVQLGDWPTPVHPVDIDPKSGISPNIRLFVKREDISGRIYGGNKIRKLEVILAMAKRRWGDGRPQLLTIGAAGSHHVLATSLYGAQHNIDTHAVLTPQPMTNHVQTNLHWTHRLAASTWPCPWIPLVPWTGIRAWSAIRKHQQKSPLIIPAGGSSLEGVLGSMRLGLEIGQDIERGNIPMPDHIYVALGTGGTAAGLLLGARLAGVTSEIVAVRVVHRVWGHRHTVLRLAKTAARWLHRHEISPPSLAGLRVIHDHAGHGYGHPLGTTPSILDESLATEPTYTGKTLAACIRDLNADHTPRNVLFVHTANTRPPPPDILNAAVPPSLLALLRPTRTSP